MERQLKDLIDQEATVYGSLEIAIRGITSDSRQVDVGFLFLVKRGAERFLPDVLQKKAAALVCDRYYPQYQEITQVVVEDISRAEEKIARAFYAQGSSLFLVGITGTNGKTTTSYLVRHLLSDPQSPCGLIGTVAWDVGGALLPSTHTTPDLCENYRLFSLMRKNGCSSAVMEVSSHALCQGRVRGIPFDVAVFTNLTQDHLDYHKTMESYCEAKRALFTTLAPSKVAVINGDSPYADRMVENSSARILTYGMKEECDVRASFPIFSPKGVSFTLQYQDQKKECASNLTGAYNLYNILAAVAVALERGMSLDEIVASLQHPVTVPGRLERVANDRGVFVFVDYAHSADALANVLSTLRKMTEQRIITVFGCGGDRDQDKRPKMGRVVEELSDLAIVTSDNPRSEDPLAIIQEIVGGMRSLPLTIPDRKEAIIEALTLAQAGDIVLIAGKGHEQGQILLDQTIPFDDREVARNFMTRG